MNYRKRTILRANSRTFYNDKVPYFKINTTFHGVPRFHINDLQLQLYISNQAVLHNYLLVVNDHDITYKMGVENLVYMMHLGRYKAC